MAGTETSIILLKIDKNKYQDQEISIVDHYLTSVSIDIPGEIPLTRLRKNLLENQATTQSVFFYDILPIQVYTRFDDNIERGDILIIKIFMENDEYYMVLQISETLGNLLGRQIVYKKHNAAPYTMAFPVEVQSIINEYKGLLNQGASVDLQPITMNIDTSPNIYVDINSLLMNTLTNTVIITV